MKRNIKKLLISSMLLIVLLFLTVPQQVSAIPVSGKACPFFAGQTFPVPPATTGDSANYHWDQTDPTIMPSYIGVCSGSMLSISAEGIWGHPGLSGPDGIVGFYDDTHDEYVDLGGISRVIAPINTLIGVFLTDEPPDPGAKPTSLTLGVDDMTVPELQQTFAIGSSLEYITVPEGATRLFLGHNDGYEWINNVGSLDVTVTIIVDIDIKPGSFPNSINPYAGGVIPVAILTTNTFDASTVNPETVALEGAGARGKGKSGNYGSMEDVDGDGDLDLVVQVVNEIDWAPDAMEATLTGNLKAEYGGFPIEGTDSVNIVPPE